MQPLIEWDMRRDEKQQKYVFTRILLLPQQSLLFGHKCHFFRKQLIRNPVFSEFLQSR